MLLWLSLIRDDLNCPRVAQIAVHCTFERLYLLAHIGVLLFELSKLGERELEQLFYAQAFDLRAAELLQHFSEHDFILFLRISWVGHLI